MNTQEVFTYDLTKLDGTPFSRTIVTNKPYAVFEIRRTAGVYHYWLYKTPSGANNKYRELVESKERDAQRFTNFNSSESKFVIATPKEMD